MRLGIPELTDPQIQEICEVAENAARRFVLSKVSQKEVARLDISVEAEGSKPVSLIVEIDLALTSEVKSVNEKELVNEAVKAAFAAAENYLRKLT